LEQPGLLLKNYCQLINNADEVTIQIRTDYDVVTARIVNNETNVSTPIIVTKKATYPTFSTWEFTHTFNVNDNFTIFVNGTDSVQPDIENESEPIDVDTNHVNTLKVDYFNVSNTEFVDYSTGIRHFARVVGRIPDGDDETDQNIFDNQNQKSKTYSATTFNGEFTSDPIPEYLVRQLVLAQGLKFFFIEDVQYTVSDRTPERFGQSTSKQIVFICAEVEVPGVNSDDSGQLPEPIPEDMQNTFPIPLTGVSGNQEIDVTANYMPDTMMFVLKTGSSGTVKVGTVPGGDDILSPKTITTANPVSTNDREILKQLANYENTYKLYFTITGVGVTVDINTIIKKYK
jgi:hypothetical protein